MASHNEPTLPQLEAAYKRGQRDGYALGLRDGRLDPDALKRKHESMKTWIPKSLCHVGHVDQVFNLLCRSPSCGEHGQGQLNPGGHDGVVITERCDLTHLGDGQGDGVL